MLLPIMPVFLVLFTALIVLIGASFAFPDMPIPILVR
jgi:hypothetical protein